MSKKKNFRSLLRGVVIGAAACFFASGCGNSNGDDFVITAPVVAPVVDTTAEGVARQIPSAAIPSQTIPSTAITESEVVSGVLNVRRFNVSLSATEVLDGQGAGDSVDATLDFNTVTNELTLTAVSTGTTANISFASVAGLPLAAPQTLTVGTPVTLTANDAASLLSASAALGLSATGQNLRGQILPTGWNLILMTLQPEQVIEEDGFIAAAAGSSATAYFTIDTTDVNATPPVVVRPVGNFVINDADVHAAAAFAGVNGANQRPGIVSPVTIALSNAADGNPNDGVWAANVPADTRPPQTIANLNGLLAGAYNIDASNGADRSGQFIRAQITPRALQVVRMELQPEQVIEEDGFVAAAAGSTAVGFFTIDTANAAATPPVVLRPVGNFVINDADIHAGGAFAGLNGPNQMPGTASPVTIALSNAGDGDPTDGVWAANLPGDPAGAQTIANLNGLLAGAYNIDASNGAGRTGEWIRSQITPGDLQVVRMELEPEQVVEENGFVAAAAGSTAVGFFTLNTTNAADTPQIVLRPVGNFVINDADVHAAGAFAGVNGANQQAGTGGGVVIALSNAADGDPNDGVWAANVPADTRPPQAIANLNGLLAGAYNIDASNGADRSGEFIRAQIPPRGTQVFLADLVVGGNATGRGFVTVTSSGAVVANALLQGVVGDAVSLVNGQGATLITLNRTVNNIFSSGGPQALNAAFNILEGIIISGDFSG